MAKKLSEMTDEERYGKVGAQIRKLDPEAYKNRPRNAEGNLKLLKELQERSKTTPARTLSPEEFMSPASRRKMDEASAAPASRGPSTRGGRRASAEETEANNRRITAAKASEAISRASRSGALPSDRATGYRSQVEETGMSPEERMNAVRDLAIGTAATVLPAARVARGAAAAMKAKDAASNMAGKVLARKGIPSYSERYAAGERAAARRATARAERKLDEKLASDMEGGFKRGGTIKSSASRGDGIAKKGKTRGKYV